jgi:hypothetical protein
MSYNVYMFDSFPLDLEVYLVVARRLYVQGLSPDPYVWVFWAVKDFTCYLKGVLSCL